MKRIFSFLALLVLLLAGCTTPSFQPDPTLLRVGVTPNQHPIIFKQAGQIMGIEAEYARRLGEALQREVVFIEIPWNQQLDALEENKTDIVMSGMSITRARSMRVNFCKPYLQSGLTALFRRTDSVPAGLTASTILNQNKRVGSVKNTTGDMFVMRHFNRAEIRSYSDSEKGTKALQSGEIDMFVHDAPVIWWIYARNEAELIAFPELLNVEPLAWAVGKHNMALLDQVNALLNQWEEDGTSAAITRNWLPYFGN